MMSDSTDYNRETMATMISVDTEDPDELARFIELCPSMEMCKEEAETLCRLAGLSLDAEQYRAVTDGAAFCGIKPSLYCKRRILDETKLVINLPQYMPILYQMEEVCEELRALVYLVYRENGFDPVKGADEKRLEDAIAMMQKVQQSMGEEFLRLCRVIERARYEKTADVRASYVRVNAAERRYLCELLTEKETFLQRERLEKETDLMLASEEAEGFPVLQEDDPILMELATCGRLLKRMETKQAENESPDITQE